MDDLDELEPEAQSDSRRAFITMVVLLGFMVIWATVLGTRSTSRRKPPPKPSSAEKPTAEKPRQLQPATKAKPATSAKPTTATGPPKPATSSKPTPTVAPAIPPEPEGEPREITRRTPLFTATFSEQDGALSRLVLLDYFASPPAKRAAQKLLKHNPQADLTPYGLELLGQEGTQPSLVLLREGGRLTPTGYTPATPLTRRRYELVEEKDNRLVFRSYIPELGVEVTKTFILPTKDDKLRRHLAMEVEFRNLRDAPVKVPGYLARGPGGLSAELSPASWKAGRKAPGVAEHQAASKLLYAVVATQGQGENVNAPLKSCSRIESLERGSKDEPGEPYERRGVVLWAGLETNYFASLLDPLNDQSEEMKVLSGGARCYAVYQDARTAVYGLSANVAVDAFTLGPKGDAEGRDKVVHRFRLYAGPKTHDELAAYAADYEYAIERHWYDPLSNLMVWILHGAYAVSFNYGIAIIILTIIVRLALHPLSRKSQTSMAKMQKLQPMVKEVQEKYKHDKKRQHEEMMKLYRTYGVNPFGGCLPMLLQLPVFIGLFNALRKSIELRHARFIPWWIEDLSQPDAFLGVVNLLPIISAVVMMLQQRMMPKSGDPQQQQTQKMMGYMMPIFLGFIFYSMPSGLNVYFIASMGIGFLEQKLIRRQLDKLGDLKPVRSPSRSPTKTRKPPKSRTPRRRAF